MVALDEIRAYVDGVLEVGRFVGLDDPSGVYRATGREVRRLGLALDAFSGIEGWIEANAFDALLVHRPWGLPLDRFPDLGVVAYHLPFDERLTAGFNPWLAAALGMGGVAPFGAKRGRPLGMVGAVTAQPLATFVDALEAEFGAAVEARPGEVKRVATVAVVGALWPELVAAAERRGVDCYVTGSWRPRAAAAVESSGLAVALVGHRPPEAWGLRRLGRLLDERWPGLVVAVADEPAGR